jgi:hypothetical protein
VGRRDDGGHPSSPAVTVFWEGGGGWFKLRNPDIRLDLLLKSSLKKKALITISL